MRVAIIGFPGSGKSTVFKAITDSKKEPGKQEDATKPALGTVKVKDPRLQKLFDMFTPKKITYEEFVFHDLPGFNLSLIKNVDAIIHVIGVFSGRDYKKDISDMETEFMISDLAIIEKKLESLQKELKSKPSVDKELEKNTLLKCKQALDANLPVRTAKFTKEEEKSIIGYQFLSKKPLFCVANLGEEDLRSGLPAEINGYSAQSGMKIISLSAKAEAEIKDLDESEREMFAKELGVTDFGAGKIVRAARELAGVMVFFTGSYKGDEVRAWPITVGMNAQEAAGKIHSDIQRGFIRAEVVSYEDFVKCGSLQEAKAKGLLRLEGKEYIVKDGDIITFYHNA